MVNMATEKVKMPVQDGVTRRTNFLEVALGYTKEMAMEEATRCLNCPTRPCVSGCPVKVKIPDFIAEVAKGDFKRHMKSFIKQVHCRRYAVVSGRRKRNVNSSVYADVREKPLQSVD